MSGKWTKLQDVSLEGKRVFIRMDLDVPLSKGEEFEAVEYKVTDMSRVEKEIETVRMVMSRGAAAVMIAGHIGKGEVSTFALLKVFEELLGQEITHWPEIPEELGKEDIKEDGRVFLLENMRMEDGEEENDPALAWRMANVSDVYVNESFATSHRVQTSVNALPALMKSQGKPVTMGLRFEKEVEMLSSVLQKPGKKVLMIGGAKAGDKAKYAEVLTDKFDAVLKGGLLPGVVLRSDGLDLADEAIEEYKKKLMGAGIVVVAGPMGKYEDEISEKGTKTLFEIAAQNKGYKVAGGGDTEAALEKFGLTEMFDWISVGGGAMLEFLVNETLPGIEVLEN
jgi:phosphoglycerate kinase